MKRKYVLFILFILLIPICCVPIIFTKAFPTFQVDTEIPTNVGIIFTLRISAVTDVTTEENGITLTAFFDNIVPALQYPIVAPYLLHEEITFSAEGVSSGQRLFSMLCTDYLGNYVWHNKTVFVDRTAPIINWLELNTNNIPYKSPLIFNWSISDSEGHFDRITISFNDGSGDLVFEHSIGFGAKLFSLNDYEYQRIVNYIFTVHDLAGNKAIREGQITVFVPEDERPEYAPSYVSSLNESWGRLRNRDAWITTIVLTIVFAITLPTTVFVIITYKKKKNIPRDSA